jgi:hypothetical protein
MPAGFAAYVNASSGHVGLFVASTGTPMNVHIPRQEFAPLAAPQSYDARLVTPAQADSTYVYSASISTYGHVLLPGIESYARRDWPS